MDPPLLEGALHVTTDCLFPFAVAETLVGALVLVAITTNSGSVASKTVTVPFSVAVPNKVATPLTIA